MSHLFSRWLSRGLMVVILMLLFQTVVVAQDPPAEATGEATAEASPPPTETPIPTATLTETPTETPADIPTETPEATDEPPVETATVEPPVTETPGSGVPVIQPEPPLSLLVRELFDNGDLSPWTLGAGWSLTASEGGQALQVVNSLEPAGLLKGVFLNAAAQARFLFSTGSAQISLHRSAVGSYTAALDSAGNVKLLRGDVEVATAVVTPVPAGTWRTLRLSVIGNTLRVAVDNGEVIVYVDEAPLPPGEAALSASFDDTTGENAALTNVVLVDDFFLWVPTTEFGFYPSPTPVAVIPTEPVIEPTATETPVPPTLTPTEPPIESLPSGKEIVPVAPPTEKDFEAAVEPPNNNFANATNIGAGAVPFAMSGDTTEATVEAGETMPSCGYNPGFTVWFNFTPGTTESYTLSTVGSAYDTILAVYTGSDVTALTQVICNDDISAASLQSTIVTTLTSGTTYRIQVSGFNGSWGNYNFSLLPSSVPTVPPVLVPVYPAASAIVNDDTPTLRWNEPAGGPWPYTYELQVDTVSTFPLPLVYENSGIPFGTANDTVLTPLANGNYYWRVRARNINGNAGPWSAARRFTIRTNLMIAPADNAVTVDTTPLFTWAAVTGATGYQLEISTDTAFTNPVIYTANPITPSHTLPAPLANGNNGYGIFYWRVKANVGLGYVPETPPYRTLTISPRTPSAPILDQPPTNVTRVQQPELTWFGVVSEMGATVTGYEVQIARSTAFTVATMAETSIEPDLDYTPTTLTDGIYYWRVRAVTDLNVKGLWSLVRRFTIRTTPPTMTAPAANAILTTTFPRFTWGAYAGASGYRLEIAEDIGFTTGVLFEDVTTTSFTPSAAAPNIKQLKQGVWYWRVRAIDGVGSPTAFSTPRSFTVLILTSPANNMVFTTTTTSNVTLIWAVVPGASGYTVQYDEDNTFSSPSTCIPLPAYPTRCTLTALGAGNYFWRVQILGLETVMPPVHRAFTVSPAKPLAPVLTGPANGATTTDLTPTFTWLASTSTAATPYTYEFQLDTTSTFVAPLIYNPPASPALTFTPADPDALAPGTYYWRVRTVNMHGVPGLWSVVRRVVVRLSAPVLSSPANGAVTTNSRLPLIWLAYPGATSYDIQFALDSNFTVGLEEVLGLTTTTYTPPASRPQGTWYWRVRAHDPLNAGLPTDYSAPRIYTINILTSPLNNYVFTTATTFNVLFRWALVPGATSYTLQIDDDSTFGSPLFNFPGLTTTSYTVPGMVADNYYWQVIPDVPVPPVPVYRQFTVSPAKPLTPVQVSPLVNASTSDSGPFFDWNDTTTTAGGPFTYDLQVARNTAFTLGLLNVPGLAVSNHDFADGTLTTNGYYYWRVRAVNSFGIASTWSAARRFTFDNVLPGVPVLLLPAHNVTLTSAIPSFTWRAVTGATRYEIQLGADNPPASSFLVTTTRFIPSSPLLPTTYYWRVRAIDAAGNESDWSAVRILKIASPALSAPVLNRFTTGTPTLTWAPISWTSGGGFYQVQVDNNVTFASPEFQNMSITPAPAPSVTVSPALADGTWYWRVRACRPDTTCGAWSTTGTFTIET